MNLDTLPFPELWIVDTEFRPPRYPVEGDPVQPVAWCGLELLSGREMRLWLADGEIPPAPPHGPEALIVAYAAAAEAGCYASCGWPKPRYVLDLMPETDLETNGPDRPMAGLLASLRKRGLSSMTSAKKHDMRETILRGPPYSEEEREQILHYCLEDVRATAQLLGAVHERIDLDQALLRGDYTWTCGLITARGVPIDQPTHDAIRRHWNTIRARLIEDVNPHFGNCYESGSFREARFAAWLEEQGIGWPRLPSGHLDLKEKTFRSMTEAWPQLRPLSYLRMALAQTRAFKLPVGMDGRARAELLPMATKTGRCAPKAGYIFIQPAWLRSLIKPAPGMAVAYVDYSSEEIAIAGALAEDAALLDAYASGDPYAAFGRMAGIIPPNGTKATHPAERARCKSCLLGTNYGMQARSLAIRIGSTEAAAEQLLAQHRRAFPKFWEWRKRAVLRMQLHGHLQTAFGWVQHAHAGLSDRSAANFLVQATGAEILKAAVLMLEEEGVRVLATVHDAVLVEAPDHDIEDVAERTGAIMAEASGIVLGGITLRTDATIVRDGDRYRDERGIDTWDLVMAIVHEAELADLARPPGSPPATTSAQEEGENYA